MKPDCRVHYLTGLKIYTCTCITKKYFHHQWKYLNLEQLLFIKGHSHIFGQKFSNVHVFLLIEL